MSLLTICSPFGIQSNKIVSLLFLLRVGGDTLYNYQYGCSHFYPALKRRSALLLHLYTVHGGELAVLKDFSTPIYIIKLQHRLQTFIFVEAVVACCIDHD